MKNSNDFPIEILDKLSRIPFDPGVYLYKNSEGNVIYIGKAKSLRKRVRSYFQKNIPDRKTRALVKQIADIDYIIVDSEIEAFILEANLIRRYRPRYNINLKDDKRYPYLKITNEDFPRLIVVRRKIRDGSEYFGPYTDTGSMRRILKTIVNHFGLRRCNHNLPIKNHRPCLYHDIGKCSAPCMGNINPEDYKSSIQEVRLFLRGRKKELVNILTEKMNEASENFEFEKAGAFRDAINSIEHVLKVQKIDAGLQNRDIIGAALGKSMITFSVFRVREGSIINHHHFASSTPPAASLQDSLHDFLGQLYSLIEDIPSEILLQRLPSELEELEDALSNMAGKKVKILTPKRGTSYGLLKLARQNARLELSEVMAQKKKHHLPFAVHSLQKELGLSRLPRRIEAFDISNIGEKNRVASMVMFIDGKAQRAGHRRFIIKTVDGQDDPACIHEAVSRRLSRLKREGNHLPDLLLIDGGKTQLNAAIAAAKELDMIDDIEIISLAKKFEEIHVPQFPEPVNLPKDSPAIRLLQRIRDEAHKTAIEFHRKLRNRNSMKSLLEEVPGIGPTRREKLLKNFKSLKDIKDAEPEEIKKRTAIPIDLAKSLKEFLAGYFILILVLLSCTPAPRYYDHNFKPPKGLTKYYEENDFQKPKEKPSPKEEEKSVIEEPPKYIEEVIDYANSDMSGVINYYIGTPYVYGGESIMGMDCSGFVNTVYTESTDIKVPRTVKELILTGEKVPISTMKFGDLLFFKMESSHADHVGIYVGNGKFAHASQSRGVIISNINDYYKKRIVSARRVM